MGGLGALWIVGWLGLWTIPTPSVPLPDTLELLWQAPAECPDERAVRANIVESLEGLVGPTRAVNAEGIVEATLIEDTRGYRLILTITLADTTIRRQIRARDCALLARTTGLVVGLALDPAVEVETIASPMDEQVDDAEVLEPQAPLVPEEPADDRSPPISEPSTTSREDRDDAVIDRPGDPEPLPTSRPPVDIAVRLAGGLDVGLLPIGGGLDLSIALVGPRWRAEGHGSHWFARTAVFEREPEVGANLASWSGGGRGCWVPSRVAGSRFRSARGPSWRRCVRPGLARRSTCRHGTCGPPPPSPPARYGCRGRGSAWWWVPMDSSHFGGLGSSAKIVPSCTVRRPSPFVSSRGSSCAPADGRLLAARKTSGPRHDEGLGRRRVGVRAQPIHAESNATAQNPHRHIRGAVS